MQCNYFGTTCWVGNEPAYMWRLPYIANCKGHDRCEPKLLGQLSSPQTSNTWTAVPSQLAHVNCGNCHTTLMYPYGSPSVKCAVCQYVTNVNMGNVRVPLPVHRLTGTATSASMPSTSTAMPHSQNQTVVVENPMSVDESGKLVSNVVVGVTTEKK
ncbi:hypothetical protein F0562_019597 [Nyssa sinensis]|uniref:Zinc finger LSD1-type domain-containing protein n=1 Tax=Nyssa sinensis TaxID=561372 RepID=A0A5J5BST6_9ASTE|nr:hypothetical protein F0562_019597 [Nyssa sinensis]